LGEEVLKVLQEAVVNKVSGGLESIVDVVVGLGVINANTKSILHLSHVEEIREVLGRSGVIARMSDIISSTSRIAVVRTLNIVSAHILCFGADSVGRNVVLTGLSGFTTAFD
jgi:hypothetical protein